MFRFRKTELTAGKVTRYEVDSNEQKLTFSEVIELWIKDSAFRSAFSQQLAISPFLAYRFETPPISIRSVHRKFEFVLLDTPGFASRKTDTESFRKFFDEDENQLGVVVFENLGKDASLIVPLPRANIDSYGHLAAFVRLAPARQVDAFWQLVGNTLKNQLGREPIWFSTAGGGVAWLHARVDQRPKYYGHRAYRSHSS